MTREKMGIHAYDASIPLVVKSLHCLKGVLNKGRASAKERGIDEAVLLQMRLAPDMHPLMRQVQMVTDNAKGIGARLSGTEIPSYPDEETTFDEILARVDKTLAFLDGLDRDAFEGVETKTLQVKLGKNEMEFTGASYLFGFAIPNLMFHAATAYDILRHAGVPLSKGDFLRPPAD